MSGLTYKDIIDAVQNLEIKIDNKFEDIYTKFDKLDSKYPSKDSFRVVQVICFSIVGSIALAFLNNLIQKNMGAAANINYIPVITPIVNAIGNTIAAK